MLRDGFGAAWARLPGKLKGVLVVAAILGGMQLNVMWTTHQHDQRLVEIYCGAHAGCADHVTADYIRHVGTPWADEAMRIQDGEDDAREDACPGGPPVGC
jgi:hypothetical protein